jgi:hypothetical protein
MGEDHENGWMYCCNKEIEKSEAEVGHFDLVCESCDAKDSRQIILPKRTHLVLRVCLGIRKTKSMKGLSEVGMKR